MKKKNNEFKIKPRKMKKKGSDLVFDFVKSFILVVFTIACLYPLIYVISCSLSNGAAVDAGKVLLLPKGINLESFKQVLTDKQFWISYGNTIFYTVLGSLFSMCVSAPAAYALSKKRFGARKVINILLSFTMWFSPGFIPLYLNYSQLGTVNNRWMILISFGIQAFNIILLRNYFESVPKEMEESANVDGANDFIIFTKIYLPLSKASLATVWLYYAMGRWNAYFWSSILIRDMDKIPLQVYLKQKIIDQSIVAEFANAIAGQQYSYNTIIYAMVVCSIIPVLCVYPFIQKFFVKGVMVGGVKG
ncbi:MAG: carbohydrate ABC transporter permease [Eubacteriales bacterium]|nr:carbohydrate ABC transporter permease [Eubacteriales bacterium]